MLELTLDIAERVSTIFQQRFGHACAAVARAPGRVNLLGEHVDYNDGFVMPAAIDRATCVAFSPSNDDQISLWADDLQQAARFTAASLGEHRLADGAALPDWAMYPAGVAWSLIRAAIPVGGMQAVYASEVPRGAGLSSSASVELAFGVSWMHLAARSLAPMQLAQLCQRAENEYVGVNCGIMDQAAAACSQNGRVMHLDCRSLEFDTLALPSEVYIIVADTGVRHQLAGSAYNDRRLACERTVAILRNDLPGIRALRDVAQEDFDRLAPKLPPELEMRSRHVVEEIERTRRAVPLLRSADIFGFGRLMNASHASLRDLYEVSCRELDLMASIAQALPGCYGARLTGAGFGGCTVNLVDRAQADAFVQTLRSGYAAVTGRRAGIHICGTSAGARIMPSDEAQE